MIEFNYNANNILKKREKPFHNKEKENVLVFIYDNNNILNTIKNSILSINLGYEIDKNKIIAYPQKYSLVIFY